MQALVETPKHPATTDKVNSVANYVLCQLCRCMTKALDDRFADRIHEIVDGMADLKRR